jgi:MoaA/NifB/PqqE/SkfB family radical SAM enzyme
MMRFRSESGLAEQFRQEDVRQSSPDGANAVYLLENREVRVLLTHHWDAVRAYKRADSMLALAHVPVCGASIDINSLCNFGNCLNCIDRRSVNQPHLPAEMPWPVLKDLVEDLADNSCKFIEIMGGEPMAFSGYGRLLRICSQSGIALKIVSNGSLAGRYVPELIEATRVPGASIRFSVNGDDCSYPRVTRMSRAVYEKVHANIALLAAGGAAVMVSFVVFPENRYSICSAASRAKEAGAARFLVLLGRHPRTKEILMDGDALLEEELARTARFGDRNFRVVIPQTTREGAGLQPKSYHRCACTIFKPVVGVDGSLYPCSYFKQRKDAVIGRIGAGMRFRDVWPAEIRVRKLAALWPSRECSAVSCTRHYLNTFVDRLRAEHCGEVEAMPVEPIEDLFF